MKKQLALLGGEKAIKHSFIPYNSIGKEEMQAAQDVVKSGGLSKFLGCWGPDFFGGPKVKEFERACEVHFSVKHAVTVNSWSSGLVAAVGAINTEPGDEIIVTPWSMCATATAILQWNAIPVFADINPHTFNIDPKSIEAQITPYTKAIIAADIFGQSCQIDEIMSLAKKHNLKVITDSAQSPGVYNAGRVTGTLADVGGFSLNYHKHIQTGEGGIVVTNDDEICERLQLIRNHAEAAVKDKELTSIVNMIGNNFRLGEIEAAIGIEQMYKLDRLVRRRQEAAEYLTNCFELLDLSGLKLPIIQEGNTHAYYIYPLILDPGQVKIPRERIIEALQAEGVQGLINGYANIHLLPMYQQKIAYGSTGFPWSADICRRDIDYGKGICPIAEQLHDKTFIGYEMCLHDLSTVDIDGIVCAFEKVWENLDELLF